MGYRALIYLRLSDEKDTAEVTEAAYERWEARCRALCQRREWEVVKVLREPVMSAWHSGTKRKVFAEGLRLLREHEAEALVAIKWARLSRNRKDTATLFDMVSDDGIIVATADGQDTTTRAGRLALEIQAMLAREESEETSERVKLRNDQRAAAGLPHGHGGRAFGYTPDSMSVVEHEARLVREAADRILAGEPVAAVLNDWRKRGITTPTGRPWKSTPLRRMLTSPRIAGLREHRGQVLGPAKWPAIIDESTRNRLLRFYAARTGSNARKIGRPPSRLYSGFVFCHCGQRMVASTKTAGKPCWQCLRGVDHLNGCGASINTEPFESVLTETVILYVCGERFAEVVRRRREAFAANDPTPEQLDADRQEFGELELILATRFADDSHRARHGELEASIREGEARLAARPDLATLADLPTIEADLRAAWAGWTTEERRRRLGVVLERVIIGPGVRGHFRAERIDPLWKS